MKTPQRNRLNNTMLEGQLRRTALAVGWNITIPGLWYISLHRVPFRGFKVVRTYTAGDDRIIFTGTARETKAWLQGVEDIGTGAVYFRNK